MNMQQLRQAFAAWPEKHPVDEAAEILTLLRDETPITEAGLRELGFETNPKTKPAFYRWRMGLIMAGVDDGKGCGICHPTCSAIVKTTGRLRMLLLSAGEK